jgi:hypothetical protein
MKIWKWGLFGALGLSAASLLVGVVMAGPDGEITIKMRNCSRQPLSPPVVATFDRACPLLDCGAEVSVELERLAEGGDGVALADYLRSLGATEAYVLDHGIAPGECTWFSVRGTKWSYVKIYSMLVDTNDGFVALDGVQARLPVKLGLMGEWTPLSTWDAGTEGNDELQAHIPGFGGEGFNPSRVGAEGYPYCHGGINGCGDVDHCWYDWRGPVAEIMIDPCD